MKKNYLLEPLRGQRTLVRKYFYFTNFSKEKYINAPGTTHKKILYHSGEYLTVV